MFMKNSNYLYAFGTRDPVIAYVADHWEFSISRSYIVTSTSEVWVICQLMKGIVKLMQVFVALIATPSLLGKNGNRLQIIFRSGFKLEGGHQ